VLGDARAQGVNGTLAATTHTIGELQGRQRGVHVGSHCKRTQRGQAVPDLTSCDPDCACGRLLKSDQRRVQEGRVERQAAAEDEIDYAEHNAGCRVVSGLCVFVRSAAQTRAGSPVEAFQHLPQGAGSTVTCSGDTSEATAAGGAAAGCAARRAARVTGMMGSESGSEARVHAARNPVTRSPSPDGAECALLVDSALAPGGSRPLVA
jgi:hypothetical protein